ncbi:MAG: Dam family site-specific DNA-(adenine-N6)-methyltransferase [Alphaproteobacteria bacterium]|nr:Dam family site-specific DNA-(adenine-N6)-methyltransferase [Alphaproteobacteria bacterium]
MFIREAAPFLKWAGGKRWILNKIAPLLKPPIANYYEPFLGGGAVLLATAPHSGYVSDINPELVNCYSIIRDRPKELYDALVDHQRHHSEAYYYTVRGQIPSNEIDRASRFMYLNRACFNGIYRVNKRGQFNVPIGTKSRIVFDTDDFEAISRILMKVSIECTDFEVTLNRSGDGSLIFIDPPYTTRHNNNGFVRYNEQLFTWADQERLCRAASRAEKRGAKIIVTNADHESLRQLYKGAGAKYMPIDRHSVIGGPSATRSKVTEALFLLGDWGAGIKALDFEASINERGGTARHKVSVDPKISARHLSP